MIKLPLEATGEKTGWIAFLLIAFLVSLAAYLPFDYTAHNSVEFYFFEADLISDHAGTTQVYYDEGRGFNEADSSALPLAASSQAVHHRYPIPPGKLKQLRFDFNDHPGRYVFAHARLADFRGQTIRNFTPADFTFSNDLKSLTTEGDQVVAVTKDGAEDPFVGVQFSQPFVLTYGWAERIEVVNQHFGPIFLLLVGAGALVWFCVRKKPVLVSLIGEKSARHPFVALAAVAAMSVVIQLHPIIFEGKSFVSPNITYLLYDHFPTVPGYTDPTTEVYKGSDVAALIYAHMEYPALQNRALFHDHELPLWNRYDLGGSPLFGQGQSMFGEVLHFIPLLARGAAWSWDAKFILARWVFAVALGFFVYRATNRTRAALAVAAVAPWIGYFEYRANHPAQFTVCLSPLILAAWAQLAAAQNRRGLLGGAMFLFFANWEVLTSGTVKEAYIAMAALDFAGLLYLIFRSQTRTEKMAQLFTAAFVGFVFVLVTAPCWWIFLDTLAVSRTAYDTPMVRQIPSWQFIGIFEDMFYRRFNPFENHGNPSTNMAVLLGVAWLVAGLQKNRKAWALVVAALVPASLAFGFVPAEMLLRVPLIGNIYHVGNTFSCPLLCLLIAMAGIGAADFIEQANSGKLIRQTGMTVLIIAGLYGLYLASSSQFPRSSFFAGYVVSLFVGLGAVALALASRRMLGSALLTVTLIAGAAVLLWRHGNYNHIYFDDYVLNPPIRARLDAPSPAVEMIKVEQNEPSRIVGFGQNLYCGAQQLYFEEGIYGIEALRSRYFDEFMVAADLPKAVSWGRQNFGGERDQSRGAMDMLNVQFYLDSTDSRPPVVGLKKEERLDLQIYESPTVWPRAFFTNSLVVDETLKSFAQRLEKSHGRPFADVGPEDADQLREMSILDDAMQGSGLVAPARAYKLTTNSTSFLVDVSAPGLIVLTETFYPQDFRIFLNDKPATYLRTNYAFKGIPVSVPGTYEVRVEYWPHHLTFALGLTGLGIVLGVIGVFVIRAPRALPIGEPVR